MNIMMLRPNLDGLPEIRLPEGYRLVTAGELPEPEPVWVEVINRAFGDQDWSLQSVRRDYVNQPQYDPAGVFFVCCGDEPVATAFAWCDVPEETALGRVHWVGTVIEHRGRGLATAVVVAVLRYFAGRGFERAMLETQSYRAPAIRCYQMLGFEPFPRSPEEEAEWALGLRNVAELTRQRS